MLAEQDAAEDDRARTCLTPSWQWRFYSLEADLTQDFLAC